jgi:hypothetical protein
MSVRKRTWTILGGAAALAFTVTAADAAEDSILPGCKGGIDGLSYCLGQISGIAYMLNLANTFTAYRPFYCADIPQNSNNRQLGQALIRYDKAHPNRFPETSFAELVVDALMDAWPCKK